MTAGEKFWLCVFILAVHAGSSALALFALVCLLLSGSGKVRLTFHD